MARATVTDDVFDRARGTRAYREAFRSYGAAVDGAGAAARVGSSRIKKDLVVALEDWIDSGMGPAVPPSLSDSRLAHIARRHRQLMDPQPNQQWHKEGICRHLTTDGDRHVRRQS